MFPNLAAEMARANYSKTMLSREMGITIGTLSLKLAGKSNLSLSEAARIKEILKVRMPIAL